MMTTALVSRFENLLGEAKRAGASDIHMIADMPPMLRITGEIREMKNWTPMDGDSLRALTEAMLTSEQFAELEKKREICVSYVSREYGRNRLAFYHRAGTPELTMRILQSEIPTREFLGLPSVIDDAITKAAGMILVTGPTGSGKTTTMNYMVDAINKSRNGKIVTIEDPVEFEHRHCRSIVTQIEVGTDTLSFSGFLRSVLRLDPDVIVIGEMRDMETIGTALTAAETGHLVLGTLHTPSAVGTAERIVNAFPGEQQPQVVLQIASTLNLVLSQRLIPTIDKQKRVVATEVLVVTDAVRNIIRDRMFYKIPDTIQTGKKYGMRSLESHLAELYRAGVITLANAIAYANSIPTMNALLKVTRESSIMTDMP